MQARFLHGARYLRSKLSCGVLFLCLLFRTSEQVISTHLSLTLSSPIGEADPLHGRGVLRGAKVGNGVAVGAGVAVAAGIGVATCACAPAKKATKPTRTYTLRKAIPGRIRVLVAGCRS